MYNKPRIICLAENYDKYIAIPRGCKNALIELLDKNNVNYHFRDETNCGNLTDVSFNGELREEQKPAAVALLKDNIGVLSATTAFGKTVIASYIISQRKTNTLILVHTQSLMNQWKDSLEKFLDFHINAPEQKGRGRKAKWSPIGILGAGKNTLHGNVDVAVIQSLFEGNDVKELVRNYGMIIVDECHHVSAVNFEAILKYANAKYIYGLTATPTRQDGHHPVIFMQCGEIKYKVDAKTQAEKRDFEHCLIPKFTSFRKSYENGTMISKIYSDLAESDLRNTKIADDAINSVSIGRTPIVLTERKEHAVKLKPMFMEERHQEISDIIKANGKITISEITEKYGISDESARRDLRMLEQKGICQRTHGGAIIPRQVGVRPPANRDFVNMPVYDNYKEISRAAVNMIKENDTVYLTSGSFGHIMISLLPREFHFTVVVNSVDTAKELRDFENIDVYVAGGKMRQSGSLVDSLANEFVSRLHFDICFITGSGLTADFGLSNGTDETAAFQRTVIGNSRKRCLLMPGTKIGVNSFIKVCDVDSFDTIITDWDCTEEQIAAIEEKCAEIIVVEESK